MDLPGFDELPPQLGPAGAEVVAQAMRWRWPDAEVSVDCAQAPCLVRMAVGDRLEARWRQWESSDLLSTVGWGEAPALLDNRGEDTDVVVGGVSDRLDAKTAERWIRWRIFAASRPESERCLWAGDLALLRAHAAVRRGWRPGSWRDDLTRAAMECHALLPLTASVELAAGWDGDRWTLPGEEPFLRCVEDAAVLGPESSQELTVRFALDDGSQRHGH
ncbi:MAG: hypothetical protein KC621_21730 [Myxococcales bacterium]|nr:hypothetical protein [Myxococcales bacterium]